MSVAGGQGADLVVVGEPAAVQLGKQECVACRDLERTGPARRDLHGRTQLFEQVPRTERTRLVVSNLAEFDPERHAGRLTVGVSRLIWSAIDLAQAGIAGAALVSSSCV